MSLSPRKTVLLLGIIAFTIAGLMPVTYLILNTLTNEGLNHYLDLLSSPRQMRLLSNTIKLAFTTTILSTLIGVLLALLLYKSDLPYRRLFILAFTSLLIIPPYVDAIAWIDLLGKEGYLNNLLKNTLKLNTPPLSIYGFWGSVFVLTTISTPLVILLTGGALNSIDKNIEEVAILAKGTKKTITRIILPLAYPGILFGALLVFINTISDFGVVSFLTYDTYTIEIYGQLAAFYDLTTATAYSIVLIAITLAIMFTYSRINGNKIYPSIFSASTTKTLKLGTLKAPAIFFTTTIIAIFLLIPIASLLNTSIYSNEKLDYLNNYKLVLYHGTTNIINSILYATTGSTITMIIGIAISYGMEKNNKINKQLLDSTLFLPYILPGTILSLGFIHLWNHPRLFIYNTPLMILLVYIAKYTIIASKTAEIALNKIHSSLEEAAEMATGSWHKILTKITIPLAAPTLTTGWALTYIYCITELNTTLTLYPPGQATLPVSIFILQHDGPPGLVAALSITLIFFTIMPLIILNLIITNLHKHIAKTKNKRQ